jgi:glycerophosphoryl diester phosphodiesterase
VPVPHPHSSHVLLDTSRRLIIAHRGASAHAPENTIPAFKLAERAGADAIELDVRLTADGVPVVIHDPTLARTTNARGDVESETLEVLQAADAGARFTRDEGLTFPWRGRGIRVPSLEEVAIALPQMPFLIELKTRAAQNAVRTVLWRTGALRRSLTVSFHQGAVETFRGGTTPTGAGRREMVDLFVRSVLRRVPEQVPYDAVFVPRHYMGFEIPVAPFVRAARTLSIAVHSWVENDSSVARALWSAGVTGIVTDDPGALRVVRDSGWAGPPSPPTT